MKSRKWALVAIATLTLGNLSILLWNVQRTPRVAYVRSEELVYGYFGMKEAMTEFGNTRKVQQANIDTLTLDLQRGMALRNELQAAGRIQELEEHQQLLQKQYNDLEQFRKATEERAAAEEQRILGSVLGQINTFVEKYAQERGYDVVLGTTASGSLLYGNGAYDITDELMVALNKDHEGIQP